MKYLIFTFLFLAPVPVPHDVETEAPREIAFEWTPPGGPAAAYDLKDPADQHRIIISPGVEKGASVPVVVAFHGQPKRGLDPRHYKFRGKVKDTVADMVDKKEIPPIILVLPVFRFQGQNWPGFDVKAFKAEITSRLEKEGVAPSYWLTFGHSGAAGCGGDGLNRAHRMAPKAVGYFDTCLGKTWQKEIKRLEKKKIKAVNIHSVETAGFRPKQRPEYQHTFDFGRAFGPLGIKPVDCPETHPGEKLRDQPYKCAATQSGTVEGFVVDTGEGLPAHQALVEVAVRYFLKRFVI